MTRHGPVAWLLVWLCSVSWWCIPGRSQAACPPETVAQATTTTVPAPPGTEKSPNQVILQSDTLEYHPSDKNLVAEGQVVVTHGTTQIYADRLELNTETGDGTASGNVLLHTLDDDLRAARADFNLTEERGVLYDSAGVLSKKFQVIGERITRDGPNAFTVQHGRVTTCTGPVPDWEFRAQKARIGLGNYVALTTPSFWVRGIPVFYFPYLIFPLRDQRTTGFLPPQVGTSKDNGYSMLTEFFWAIADWLDTTAGVEYLTKKGFKPQLEFRYVVDPLSYGRLEAAYIHEQDTHDTLWRVLLQQQQEFGWGVRGISQLDLRSDLDLVRRFSRDIRQESDARTVSFGTLTKLFPNSSLTLAGESYEGLPELGITEEFRRLPTLRFTQFPTPLLGVAFFEVDTSYSRLSDTLIANNDPVQRLDLFPQITLPLSVGPWLRFAATAGVHETFYDHQVSEGDSTSRQLVDLRAHLEGPTLWRRYAGPNAQQAVVHMIESRLDYRYVPPVGQGDIPPFETLDEAVHFLDPLETFTLNDRITAANYAKVSLINRVFLQGISATAPRSVQEVAHIALSQGFDFRETPEPEGTGQLLGPLDVEMTFLLWQRLQLTTVLRWQPANRELSEVNWRAAYTIASGWVVYAQNNNRFQDPETRYVTGGIVMAPLTGLQVSYNFRYDGLSGALREHLLMLLYQAQCWKLTMRYRIRDLGDTDFFINVDLFRF